MKKALVIGGARSGYGAACLLKDLDYDVTLVSRDDFDSRHVLEAMGVRVILNDQDTDQFDDVDLVIKNPGIPNEHPLVKRFDKVYNEIDVATQYHTKGTYYAISGTNGKTTTVTLLYEMLKRKDKDALLAGNVGFSLSEVLHHEKNTKRDVALEISAFQMEGTPNFNPHVYALLNLTPDHLDRYESESHYYQAKLDIIPRADIFIRNIDDENIRKLTHKTEQTLDISLLGAADVYLKGDVIYFKSQPLFSKRDLKIVGDHNLFNATVAAVMAYLAGVKLEDIQSVLQEFKGVEHRLEYVDEIKGVAYYNDSKATNPESTYQALKAFDLKRVILLAGGFDKKIHFNLLEEFSSQLKSVHLFGDSKSQMHETFPNATLHETMTEAFQYAHKKSKKGDIILLSPACASYDQFKDFEERGHQFKQLVKGLITDKGTD